MAENIDLDKVKSTLKKLVDVLRDSHQGFMELEKELQNPTTKHLFLEQTQVRANFAAEITNELHHLGVKDVDNDGMISGKLHRTWGELKAKLGGGDHAILATAEQGEDAAKKAYKEALQEHLPGDIRDLLTRQQTVIVAAHDKVRDLRDSTAS